MSESEQRLRRARELLAEAGWLFDDFVNAETRRLLMSRPDQPAVREEAWRRARVAMELKAGLEALVEAHEADRRLHERREKQQETRHGR